MSAILNLKRWHKERYVVDEEADISIGFELKRLKRHEARPLQQLLAKIFQVSEKAKEQNFSAAEQTEALQQVYELMPDTELKGWFSECVRNVEGLYIDGDAITTGNALLEEADDQLVMFLLLQLYRLSKLDTQEEKDSASPSTSSALVERGNGSSGAASIESEAGQPPSTVTEIQVVALLCSGPAGA